MDMQQEIGDLKSRMDDLDAKINALLGPHTQEVLQSVDPAGAVVEGPHTEIILSEGPPPGMSPADWLSGINGSPGILVDPGIARSTPCLRLELGANYRPLVYSKGIVGALDEEQEDLYCQEGYESRQATPEQVERIEALREAAHDCSVEAHGDTTEQHIQAYFSCLGKELRSRGIEP